MLAGVADGTETVVDGLALANLGEVVAAMARRLPVVAFVHGPLAQESGLPPAEAKRAAQREAALLSRLRGVLCPSRKTAAAVGGYGVSPDRIAVVPPGTVKPKWYLRPRRGPVRALLCVANLLPGKGHGVLVEALAQLRDLDWNLLCVGSLKRDPSTARFVRRMILAAGLERRITLAGEWPPQSVAHAYRKADAFVLPSFHEGYGMVFAEAMAHGLPLIATAAGAIPETVSPEAALFVPPGDFGGSGAGASPGDLRACARRAARCGVTRGGRSPARMAESDGRVGKGIGSPYGSQSALARTLSEGEALNAALVELESIEDGTCHDAGIDILYELGNRGLSGSKNPRRRPHAPDV